MTAEIELKLLIYPADILKLRRMPALKVWSRGRPVSRKLISIYYDTPKLALWHVGITLRVCRIGHGWIQTIKEGDDVHAGLHQRMEWEHPVVSSTPDFSKITDHKLPKLFSHHALRDQLQPVFITVFRRTSWLLSFAEGDEIELSLDQGEVKAGQSVAPVCEVELELKAGRPKKLYEVALQLLKSVQLMPENYSKAERGYTLYTGAPTLPVKAAPLDLTPTMSVNDAFKAIAANCFVHLQANQKGMLLGQDPEYLHQMRIALRRLRSAQSLFVKVVPRATYTGVVDDLKWLAEQLGPARDWDVFMTETLPPLMEKFPEDKALKKLHGCAFAMQRHYNEIAHAAVYSHRYAKLILALGAWLAQEEWRDYQADVQQHKLSAPVDILARQSLDRLHKKLRRHGRHLTQLSIKERHAVRIEAKKLRYAAEFFYEMYHQKRGHSYLNALTCLQDGLGALNDVATTQRLLASLLTSESEFAQDKAVRMVTNLVACKCLESLASMRITWEVFLRRKPFWKK